MAAHPGQHLAPACGQLMFGEHIAAGLIEIEHPPRKLPVSGRLQRLERLSRPADERAHHLPVPTGGLFQHQHTGLGQKLGSAVGAGFRRWGVDHLPCFWLLAAVALGAGQNLVQEEAVGDGTELLLGVETF